MWPATRSDYRKVRARRDFYGDACLNDQSVSAVPTHPAPPSASTARKVLLVEDHADTATVITLLLKKFGHTVTSAGSVAAGLAAFEAGAFDVVLSDLGLPDGTGIDFVTKLRQRAAVPAVALTGYGMEEDVRRCLDAGFDAHLTKPVNFAELNAVIQRLTAKA